MKPVPGDVHINRPLTYMSLAILQSLTAFKALSLFPIITSQTQSDAYFTFDQRYFNRDTMKLRAPGARAELIKYAVSQDNFFCRVWAVAHPIPDELRANADSPLNLDMQANEVVVRAALIRLEKMWIDTFFQAGVWTGRDLAGVPGGAGTDEFVQWDATDSDPITNIGDASIALMRQNGIRPNTLVVGPEVDLILKRHVDIMARVQYGGSSGSPALITDTAIAAIFGVDKYVVLDSIVEESNEGAAQDTQFIAGKKALLLYVPSSPGIMKPASGYTFAWTGLTGATQTGYRIKKFRMEPESSDVVQIDMAVEPKLTGPSLGAMFDAVVS
jgi:hypothetical protein